jgi:uncharacterized protein
LLSASDIVNPDGCLDNTPQRLHDNAPFCRANSFHLNSSGVTFIWCFPAQSNDKVEPSAKQVDIKKFIERLVTELVDEPESVHVEVEDLDQVINVRVCAASGDIGKLIGKQGRTASAIRTLLIAIAGRQKKRSQFTIEGS